MKSSLIIVLAFLFTCLQSKPLHEANSNVYVVDYKLEYNIIYPNNPTENHTVIYYINSKANNFFAVAIYYKGKINVYCTDFGGKVFTGTATPGELALVEKEGLTGTFSEYTNPYKDQINNYDFFAKGDTVINNHECSKYLLCSTKPKLEKKKKLAHQVYFIDASKPFVPMLIHPTAYEIWKYRKSISNGLLIQKDDYDFKNILITSEKLISVTPVNFKITLTGETTKITTQ